MHGDLCQGTRVSPGDGAGRGGAGRGQSWAVPLGVIARPLGSEQRSSAAMGAHRAAKLKGRENVRYSFHAPLEASPLPDTSSPEEANHTLTKYF